MKLTKGMLLDRFIEYNNLYFDGKLGRCEFSFLRKKDSAYGTYLRQKSSSGNEKLDKSAKCFKSSRVISMPNIIPFI